MLDNVRQLAEYSTLFTIHNIRSETVHRNVSKTALRAKLILKCFQSRDPGLLARAFCTFVRPILEYGCTIWNPLFKRDIGTIESVQRQFIKRLKFTVYLTPVDLIDLV